MPLLLESDLDPDPFAQFDRWYRHAAASGLPLWDGMAVSTATRTARPSSRVMLLKGFDQRGFVFFTNYQSRKSAELNENPFAALLFWWPTLDRQIRIEGGTEPVTARESDEYFATRPRGSQLGAWASNQSEVIPDRDTLVRRLEEVERKYAGKAVPRPSYWGGFRLKPEVFEFWQNQTERLHDRLRYRRGRDGEWIIERLAP